MHNISPAGLRQWQEQRKDFVLIDLREKWERDIYHIGGENLPFSELMSRLAEIPKNRDVVLYCEKGVRSVIAIQRLEQYGYEHLHNLAGGISAWKKESQGTENK